MLKRALGDTGLEVSALGLGTVKFGRNAGVDYAGPFNLPSDGRIAELLVLAKTSGINLLDTAPAYGTSEARLGEAIQGEREDWLICTKAGEEFDGVRSRHDFSQDHILRSVARSLRRLRTDILDIVLVHSDGRAVAEIEAAGAFRALARLHREGVVRAVGFSGKTRDDGREALRASLLPHHPHLLMCTINASYRDEVQLAREAAREGAGVLVKKPLAQGLDVDPRNVAAIARLPGVSSVVVGTTSTDHLSAHVGAVRALGAAEPNK